MEIIAIIGSIISILRIFKIHLLVIIVDWCSNIQGIEVKKGEIIITRINCKKNIRRFHLLKECPIYYLKQRKVLINTII